MTPNQIIKTEAIEAGRILIPITKANIDTEKRLIKGLATEELADLIGDVVDFDSFTKAAGVWKGNVREMHQPKAVGKAVEVEFDHDAKKCYVTSYISKGAADTWEKILDGTLSCYSVGINGTRQIEKTAGGEIVKRVIVKDLVELSVCDAGMLPTAEFSIVKSLDGVLTATQQVDAPTEAAVEPTRIERVKKTLVLDTPAAVTVYGIGLVKMALADRDLAKTLLIAGAYEKGPDFVKMLPQAWRKDADQTPAPERVTLYKARLAAITKGETTNSGVRPQSWDIDRALCAIGCIENLLANEAYEVNWDAEAATPEAVAQLAMLKSACETMIAFLASEFAEQFQAAVEVGTLLEVDGIEMVAQPVPLEKLLSLGAAITKAVPTVWTGLDQTGKGHVFFAKAGARHSKKDQEMIQDMHDTSVALGGGCATKEEKAAAPGLIEAALAAGQVKFLGKDRSELVEHGVLGLQVLDKDGKAIGEFLNLAPKATAVVQTPDEREAQAEKVLRDAGITNEVVLSAAKAAARTAEALTALPIEKKVVETPVPAVPEAIVKAAGIIDPAVGDLITKMSTQLTDSAAALVKVQTTLEASQATATAQAATIADLEKKVEAYGQQPRKGGPVARASAVPVAKTLGNAGNGGGGDADIAGACAVIEGIIKKTTNENDRMDLAEKLTKLRQGAGLDLIEVHGHADRSPAAVTT